MEYIYFICVIVIKKTIQNAFLTPKLQLNGKNFRLYDFSANCIAFCGDVAGC